MFINPHHIACYYCTEKFSCLSEPELPELHLTPATLQEMRRVVHINFNGQIDANLIWVQSKMTHSLLSLIQFSVI